MMICCNIAKRGTSCLVLKTSCFCFAPSMILSWHKHSYWNLFFETHLPNWGHSNDGSEGSGTLPLCEVFIIVYDIITVISPVVGSFVMQSRGRWTISLERYDGVSVPWQGMGSTDCREILIRRPTSTPTHYVHNIVWFKSMKQLKMSPAKTLAL